MVISMQTLVFCMLAYKEKVSPKNVRIILLQSFSLGFVFGVPFDLFIGKFVGIFTYTLGFTTSFLLPNGILSYGLWAATVILLAKKKLFSFLLHVSLIAVIYEITNVFFPVWQWTIHPVLWLEIGIVLFGYFGLALLGALIARLIYKIHFVCLE